MTNFLIVNLNNHWDNSRLTARDEQAAIDFFRESTEGVRSALLYRGWQRETSNLMAARIGFRFQLMEDE